MRLSLNWLIVCTCRCSRVQIRVPASMKRGYTALEFKSKIRQLRLIRPDISITSDFIVGFPGETSADFEATLKLIDEVGFDASFSLTDSPRPGTPASDMPDEISSETKQARLLQLQSRIEEHTRLISQKMVGSTQKVLVKGQSKKMLMSCQRGQKIIRRATWIFTWRSGPESGSIPAPIV